MSTLAPRTIAWRALAAFLLFGVRLVHAGSSGSCTILVRRIDGLPAQQARILCSAAQSPCHGQLQVTSDGRTTALFIKASSSPGNVYLKFYTADHDLSVGSNPYLHLAVGEAGSVHRTVGVSIASEFAQDDNPTALNHRPVLRAPGQILAVLRVDIVLDR